MYNPMLHVVHVTQARHEVLLTKSLSYRQCDHQGCSDRALSQTLPGAHVAFCIPEWPPPGLSVCPQQTLLLRHVALQEVYCWWALLLSSHLPHCLGPPLPYLALRPHPSHPVSIDCCMCASFVIMSAVNTGQVCVLSNDHCRQGMPC